MEPFPSKQRVAGSSPAAPTISTVSNQLRDDRQRQDKEFDRLPQEFVKERIYLKGVSPKTVIWYNCSFKAFAGALDSKTSVIDRIAQLKAQNVSNISINTYLRCLNAYFRWLHTEHGKPLIKMPKLKEEQKIIQTLSREQIRALVSFRPNGVNQRRAWTVSLLILDSGLRISEALGLTKEMVNLEQLTVTVIGKGGKHRVIPVSQEMRKRLYLQLRHCEQQYLFATRTGRQMSVRNFLRDFKGICKKAGIQGIRTSPHTLRHSFAVHYLRNGGNIEFLRRCLGHNSILTTQKYLKSLGVKDLQAVHSALSPLSASR